MKIANTAGLAVCLALGGCGTFYVDDTLKEVTGADKVAVAQPLPVQMLFEFQTKGVRNAAATDYVKKDVDGVVKSSGLFSTVSEAPVSGGAVVNLTVNNVPLDDNAFAKGFATGFTLGLVGNTVGDGYICTVDYLPAGGGAKITKSVKDAIYTSIGATASEPKHARKMKSADEAVKAMTRKCLGNPLNDLARDLVKATP